MNSLNGFQALVLLITEIAARDIVSPLVSLASEDRIVTAEPNCLTRNLLLVSNLAPKAKPLSPSLVRLSLTHWLALSILVPGALNGLLIARLSLRAISVSRSVNNSKASATLFALR